MRGIAAIVVFCNLFNIISIGSAAANSYECIEQGKNKNCNTSKFPDFEIKMRPGTFVNDKFSQVTIVCEIPKTAIYNSSKTIIVYNKDTKSTLLNPDFFSNNVITHEFTFIINDSRLLGKLVCKLNGYETHNSISLSYLPCDDKGETCHGAKQCDPHGRSIKFCYFTRQGTYPCASIQEPSWCDFENKEKRYCPVNKVGICSATIADYNKTWFEVAHTDNCPSITDSESPLSFKGISISFGQVLLIESSNEYMSFNCPKGSPFYNQHITYADFFKPIQLSNNPCRENITLHYADGVFLNETSLTPLRLFTTTNSTNKTENVSFLVQFVHFDSHLKIQNTSFGENPIQGKCQFTKIVLSHFRVTTWLIKTGTKETVAQSRYQWLWFSINTTGLYHCKALIELQRCSPHRYFNRTFYSSALLFEVISKKSSFRNVYSLEFRLLFLMAHIATRLVY